MSDLRVLTAEVRTRIDSNVRADRAGMWDAACLLQALTACEEQLTGALKVAEGMEHEKQCASLCCGNCIYTKGLHSEYGGELHCSTDQCLPRGNKRFAPKAPCNCARGRLIAELKGEQ